MLRQSQPRQQASVASSPGEKSIALPETSRVSRLLIGADHEMLLLGGEQDRSITMAGFMSGRLGAN
jgi:hypothetical protein